MDLLILKTFSEVFNFIKKTKNYEVYCFRTQLIFRAGNTLYDLLDRTNIKLMNLLPWYCIQSCPLVPSNDMMHVGGGVAGAEEKILNVNIKNIKKMDKV